MSKRANVWVYKCNRNEQDFAEAVGDWQDVFDTKRSVKWGGSWCTNNPQSKHFFNEGVAAGDLVLAYQTDDRNIIGVCEVTRITGKPNERILYLKGLHRFD